MRTAPRPPASLRKPTTNVRLSPSSYTYRSRKNEKFLASRLLRSQIHRKKPKGAPLHRQSAPANARKSAIRSAVEHVFARQKGAMSLFVRTIGIARARTKIGLANPLYNMQRMVWLMQKATAT